MTGPAGEATLPADTGLGQVRLRVRDASRSAEFYAGVLGLQERNSTSGTATFGGLGGAAAISLVEDPAVAPRPPGTGGLYHVALLFPGRASLGAVLARLIAVGHPLQGFADHHVSEAIYLADPDGNGLELYVDRPPTAWERTNGGIFMTTRPLDAEALLDARSGADPRHAPAETRVGHIHLQVNDLAAAHGFYHGTVGFDVVNSDFPGALFLSAGGYHHHVGLNTWGRAGLPPDGIAGLIDFELRIPSAAARQQLAGRAGLSSPADDTRFPVRDPDGNTLIITA